MVVNFLHEYYLISITAPFQKKRPDWHQIANNWISVGLFSILFSKNFTLLLEAHANEFGHEREHHGSHVSLSFGWWYIVQCHKEARLFFW